MSIPLPSHFILIHGKTGAGKTRLLSWLKSKGQPVLDLEAIAHHRGSAFGANSFTMGQPDKESFEQQINEALLKAAVLDYCFVEQKGNNIGKRRIPEYLKEGIDNAMVIQLESSPELRIRHIREDYFSHPTCMEDAMESLMKLKEKMDPKLWMETKKILESGDKESFIKSMLEFYDASTRYHLTQNLVLKVYVDADNEFDMAANQVIEFVQMKIRTYS
jgi:tRNA 2-selenouridine synthase